MFCTRGTACQYFPRRSRWKHWRPKVTLSKYFIMPNVKEIKLGSNTTTYCCFVREFKILMEDYRQV
jgi:hypothetical protein